MRGRRRWSWLWPLVALGAVACRGEPPTCAPGDRLSCRCGQDPATAAFGYQTCSVEQRFEGPCACPGGLAPDAGPSVYDRCGVASSYQLECGVVTDAVAADGD